MGQGRHRNPHGDQFALFVLDEGDIAEIQQAEIGIDITVNYFLRKHRKIEELAVGPVDQVENLLAVLFLPDIPLGDLADVEVVALGDDGGAAAYPLGHLVGHIDPVFDPVVHLGHAQRLEMLPVIGIIVFQHEGTDVVEPFHDAAFIVKIRETEGAADLGHAMLLAEGDHRIDEAPGDLHVIDEIHPSEAHFGMVPVPVGNLVDDGHDTAAELAVLVSQELGGLAVAGHRILFRQRMHFIQIQVRDIMRAILVEADREPDKVPQVFPALYFLDNNGHEVLF